MRIQHVVLITKRVAIDHPCPGIPVNTGMLLVIHGRTLKDDRERGIGFYKDKIGGSEKQNDIEYNRVICEEGLLFLDQVWLSDPYRKLASRRTLRSFQGGVGMVS